MRRFEKPGTHCTSVVQKPEIEHPPLSKLIAGLPLAIKGAHADYSHTSWVFSGRKLFNQYLGEWVFGHWFLMRWNDPQSTIWWARVPMLLLTLVLGYALYTFGSRLGGAWGGLLGWNRCARTISQRSKVIAPN